MIIAPRELDLDTQDAMPVGPALNDIVQLFELLEVVNNVIRSGVAAEGYHRAPSQFVRCLVFHVSPFHPKRTGRRVAPIDPRASIDNHLVATNQAPTRTPAKRVSDPGFVAPKRNETAAESPRIN